jgi:hypothetical protein
MPEKLFYKDNHEELQDLFSKNKPFVLFLGAGVNGDFHKMMWADLLKYLLDSSMKILATEEGLNTKEKDELLGMMESTRFSAYHKAMFIKKVLGENYIGYLQSYIYSNCNRHTIKQLLNESNPDNTIFLAEIAKLILNRDNIHAVVTYNYDNFLTETVKLLKQDYDSYPRKIECVDIYRSVQQKSHEGGKFPVYHVHGYIPPPDETIIQEPENVVLSMDEYFNNMIEPFSWQTTTQLYFLNNYNCLFLGASLDDWNMLRALSYSHHFSKATRHFVIFANEDYERGSRVSTFINRARASVYEDVGVKTIYTTTGDFKEIHSILKNLPTN